MAREGIRKGYFIHKLKRGALREQLIRLGIIKPDEKITIKLAKELLRKEEEKGRAGSLLARRLRTAITLIRLQRKIRRRGRK